MVNIKLGKVDHFAYHVSDMDKSIEFYRDVLGLSFLSVDKDEEHGEAFAFFDIDKEQGAKLELLQKIDESNNGPLYSENFKDRINSPHLAFETTDIESDLKELKEKGVNIIDGPLIIPDKVTWAYFSDPDNNILELITWLE